MDHKKSRPNANMFVEGNKSFAEKIANENRTQGQIVSQQFAPSTNENTHFIPATMGAGSLPSSRFNTNINMNANVNVRRTLPQKTVPKRQQPHACSAAKFELDQPLRRDQSGASTEVQNVKIIENLSPADKETKPNYKSTRDVSYPNYLNMYRTTPDRKSVAGLGHDLL